MLGRVGLTLKLDELFQPPSPEFFSGGGGGVKKISSTQKWNGGVE